MSNLDIKVYFQESVVQTNSERVQFTNGSSKSDNLFCLVNDDHFNYVPDDQFDDELLRLESYIKEARMGNYIHLSLLELILEILINTDNINNFKTNVELKNQNNIDKTIISSNNKLVRIVQVYPGFDWDFNKEIAITEYKLILLNNLPFISESRLKSDIYRGVYDRVNIMLNSKLSQIKEDRRLISELNELIESVRNTEQRYND